MKKLIFLKNFPNDKEENILIESLNLTNHVLSIKEFKMMISGLDLNENKLIISEKNNFRVFGLFFEILEERMKSGLLTVIKETEHFNERFVEKIKILCRKYNYEFVVVDFCFKRVHRKEYPSFIKTISPQNLEKEIQLKFVDISKYKKVIHIGDIHGCFDPLIKAVPDIKFDVFYIFLGDYIDRGTENVSVLKYLMKIKKKPNVVFIQGNHEINLIKYCNNEEIYSKSFESTKAELEKSNIDQIELKDFCNRLQSFFAYQYKGRKVFCSHGGLSAVKDIHLISENTFISGSDSYESDIDKLWEKNVQGLYQVHGHRNEFNHPINASESSFNLDDDLIEAGGNLRTLELSNNGFNYKHIKNSK